MPTRILVPTDGSDEIEAVYEEALTLARDRDATVEVVFVVDDRAFLTMADDLVEEATADLTATGRGALDEAVDFFGPADVAVETALREGNPAAEIVAHAEERDCDRIVMGTHEGDFTQTLAGSITQQVVAAASVPVVTVPLTASDPATTPDPT